MNDERDELIDRVVETLAEAPPVRSGAVARVLMAVRAAGARRVPFWRRAAWWAEDTNVSARAAGLLIAASLAVGFVMRGSVSDLGDAPSTPVATDIPLQSAANRGAESRMMPVALVFEQPNATSVAVVGDFNGWDPNATPMERVGAKGPWSATVLAAPGRHTYAYLVDGATLVTDPLAPKAPSADFGGDASVMMVRTP
ncbi:MAG TPA: isoamylase early set domain-containing protein [Gemmatimonadaceae bacterium]|nr:isoamylase early set domain-containing protein [Gemmatimonadaceae bacterium]